MSDKKTTYIKFFASVNSNSINQLMNSIDTKLREGTERFVLLISSPGGSVFHGMTAHNYLRGIPAEIITHNFGSVDSIGVIIYLAGSKRYSVSDARFQIHPVSYTFKGEPRLEEMQLEEKLKSLRIDTENIASVIANETNKTEKSIIKEMHNRTTLNPEQAIGFGIVHEIKADLFPKGAEFISINMG